MLEGPSLGSSRYYSSHVQVVLEPLDVTSEQNFILFLTVCGHRRRQLSLSDLFRASFTYEIPELRIIRTNVRGLRSFLWKVPAAKCFIGFFYGWRYSIAVIIQAWCAFELWLLPLSGEGQWRRQWRVVASVLGRADPCWPLGLNVPLHPSAWELKSCAFS